MRKGICVLLVFCLILGLFAACSSPVRQFNTLTRELSQLENYSFTAVGELWFEDGTETGAAPLRYVMEGVRSTETGRFSATLLYTDLRGRQLYDMSLVEINGVSYVHFLPLFQYLMDLEYAAYEVLPVAAHFEGTPYLIHPTLELSNLLTDLPALLNSLGSSTVREALTVDQGVYALEFSGAYLSEAMFLDIFRPFLLFFELEALTLLGEGTGLSPLLSDEQAQYTLDLVFVHDAEINAFTSWLTLSIPGVLTLTADVTYQEIAPPPIAPPQDTLELAEVQGILAEYRRAQARRIFIETSGLEIVTNLPELHMVNHQLSTDLLEPFDIEIGGELFQVPVMANANNAATDDMVFSYSPGIMTIRYTALDAHSASETMALFILDVLVVDDLDAENFQRTEMRINAHDTAAVKALYYDDNLMGRTLHIYVLQNVAGTDQALFLGVVAILDNMNNHARDVLDRLGWYIGIDFRYYLDLASE